MTLALGVFLETAALLGASWSTEIWQLYLSQGVCFGWGLGMQYLSTTYLIPQWFEKHRSLAAGICTAGTGTGGIIYSLATHAMLARFGIPWSYRILAIVQLVVNAICVLVIRDRRPQGVRAYQMPKINFRLYLRYEISVGLTSTQGSIVTAVMNIGQMFGRPTVGLLSDRIGRINMAAFATCIGGLLCLLLWVFALTYASLTIFALFAGIFFGTFWTVVGPLGAEVVCLDDLQSGLTIMWLAKSQYPD
ncbi:hypothetical protein PENFLA_c008G03611 [Penicillium flavigenum]|uniref:Major facilitator superfamily (MFS) profile domain-containing protein n=1 Tax=Penicillium flavigenum TaxID=254877 RepID=A0A1V6TI37_9EURO|nr:hypothetical protein PENFLA_c008G03611 [Penicillium flavigenum]